MRGLAYRLAGLLIVTALMGGSASAGVEWCAEDPVFQVLGANFRVTTSVSAPASSVSSIVYDVTLPSDAAGSAAVHYPKGRRLPTTVNVTYTGASGSTFQVSMQVTVISSQPADVLVSLTGPSVTAQQVSGTTAAAVPLVFTATGR